jgi:hypothetical protein
MGKSLPDKIVISGSRLPRSADIPVDILTGSGFLAFGPGGDSQ